MRVETFLSIMNFYYIKLIINSFKLDSRGFAPYALKSLYGIASISLLKGSGYLIIESIVFSSRRAP